MKEQLKPLLPMKLQFFAEEDGADDGTGDDTTPPVTTKTETSIPPKKEEQQLSLEEQLQQMRVENAKFKKAFDNTAKELASNKKLLRARQTEDEIALQEKAEKEAEREAEIEELKKENMVTKYEKSFLSLGYPTDLATKAANAQYENETDILFKTQQDFIAIYGKKQEAEWLKNRPTTQTGTGEGGASKDAFLQGFNSN